ncbi:hypothetical protein ACR9GP_23475 [Enterobacter ludwigii]
MKNPHQIIGEVVHQLIQENHHIDYSIIQHRLVNELVAVTKQEYKKEEVQIYEEAMKMFTADYRPKF